MKVETTEKNNEDRQSLIRAAILAEQLAQHLANAMVNGADLTANDLGKAMIVAARLKPYLEAR